MRTIGAHRVGLDYTCGVALKAFCRGLLITSATKNVMAKPEGACCSLIVQTIMEATEKATLLCRIRAWLAVFIVGLVLSGVTAFPLERETAFLDQIFEVS